jgi:transposase
MAEKVGKFEVGGARRLHPHLQISTRSAIESASSTSTPRYITVAALAASVTDPHRFTSTRQFGASLGLTPEADSSAGKDRMGRISKMGDRYLRHLLVIGMTSQLQSARRKPEAHPWITNLLVSKPNKLVALAMANKAARIAWVIMTRGEVYRALTR